MIPRDIHFIFFGMTRFDYVHWLAIKSAVDVHRDCRVHLHHSVTQEGNPLWADIMQRVNGVHIDPPTHAGKVPLTTYQYRADIARLEILIKRGGIYLDIDVMSLRPFDDELFQRGCVVGIEAADDPDTTDLSQARSVSNAAILAEPGHPFLVDWLARIPDALEGRSWAHHAVVLPLQMLREGVKHVTVLPRRSFMPFDFRDAWVFEEDETQHDARIAELNGSYTAHLWETIWYEKLLKKINAGFMQTSKSAFAKMFRKHV